MFALSAFASLAIAACGGTGDEDPDLGPIDRHEPCWPGYDNPELADGYAELLASSDPITPFSDGVAQVEHGLQGGYHVPLSGQIQGLDPGAPVTDTAGENTNPQILFSIYSTTGERLSPDLCPLRRTFQPTQDDNGMFALAGSRSVVIDNEHVPEIFGQAVRLVLEVRDCEGAYAHDEVVVTLLAPPEVGHTNVIDVPRGLDTELAP